MKHVSQFRGDTTERMPHISDELRAAVGWLWAQLSELHGRAWTESHGDKIDPKSMWAAGLFGMTQSHVVQAFKLWLQGGSARGFPPKVPAQIRGPWEKQRRESPPPLPAEEAPPPLRDESAKGRAWRGCQAAFATRITGLRFPDRGPFAIPVWTIAGMVPLPVTPDIGEHKLAFGRLKREFEREWTANDR